MTIEAINFKEVLEGALDPRPGPEPVMSTEPLKVMVSQFRAMSVHATRKRVLMGLGVVGFSALATSGLLMATSTGRSEVKDESTPAPRVVLSPSPVQRQATVTTVPTLEVRPSITPTAEIIPTPSERVTLPPVIPTPGERLQLPSSIPTPGIR